MPQLIGREREIATALELFSASVGGSLPRILMVEGTSGVGKTAFLADVAERLQREGALVVGTAAYRMQETVPHAAVSRIVEQIAKSLGDAVDRYLGGVNAASDPTLALVTALEGLTLDRPVALLLDDVQWIDEESVNALATAIPAVATRRLFITFVRRDDLPSTDFAFDFDRTIHLQPLSDRNAEALARASFPAATSSVIREIVKHGLGMPLDIIALAEAAAEVNAADESAVEKSTRSVIARRIRALNGRLRTFLQILSLLPEPIEYHLLARLWPDPEELSALIAESTRYLVGEHASVRFRHALVGEAVLETIAVKIPLHRRIIEAISNSDRLRIEDKLLIADQAEAAGDYALAKATLFELASQAGEEGLIRMAISAFERHLALGEPGADQFKAFYETFAKALTFAGMYRRAETVSIHALSEARRRNLGELGALAAQLILSECFGDRYEAAKLTYANYLNVFHDKTDLAMLHAAALWFYVCEQDVPSLNRTIEKLEALNIEYPPDVRMRMEIAQVFVECRAGDYQSARKRLPRITDAARQERSANSKHADFISAYVELMQFGPRGDHAMLRLREGDPRNSTFIYFSAHSLLHRARLDDAILLADDALRRTAEPADRPRMLGVAAAVYALCGTRGDHWKAIETNALRFAAGERSPFSYNAAMWSAASGFLDDATSSTLLDCALPHAADPGEPMRLFWLLPVPIAAQRLKRRDILTKIADGTAFWNDAQPMIALEREATRALALHFLGKAPPDVDALVNRCVNLDMSLVGVLLQAHCFKGAAQSKAANDLHRLGITLLPSAMAASATTSAGKLTSRERQISELISNGKTNKEIAEQLVLSERTVEGHVANIFNKLGVSSRTQIAAWVFGQLTPAP